MREQNCGGMTLIRHDIGGVPLRTGQLCAKQPFVIKVEWISGGLDGQLANRELPAHILQHNEPNKPG